MKIVRLKITNFRAIKNLEISNLSDTVVIAGPNGSGKSCIFDAIRLIKSAYGGYNPNEIAHWFSEFQIDLNRLEEEIPRLLNDQARPLTIEADFKLAPEEIAYLDREIETVSDNLARMIVLRDHGEGHNQRQISVLAQRFERPEIQARKDEIVTSIKKELSESPVHTGRIQLDTGVQEFTESSVLSAYFSMFSPDHLGIIEYHSATRNYNREQFGGLQLNIRDQQESRKQHSLYNTAQRYANIKSEMASAYVREMLAREAGVDLGEKTTIVQSLKEMFVDFFDGKEFQGPLPTEDGRLAFQVRTKDGSSHDINELSSGEKEVLFGYLRLRNSTPRNSILLLDEPELHLNPRLIRGLPRFYQQHIGVALANQLWLVTHSDAFLRETVGQPGFSVFHMRSPLEVDYLSQQLVKIEADRESEAAIIDLVGDLATYNPSSRIVIFEGGGDTEFDKHFVKQLFPEFALQVNLISGENRTRVTQLQHLLKKARDQGALAADFFSVIDRDSETVAPIDPFQKCWDVYHIENYLLDSAVISEVLNDLETNGNWTAESIERNLKICAERSQGAIIEHTLRQEIDRALQPLLRLKYDPALPPTDGLSQALSRAVEGVVSAHETQLCSEALTAHEKKVRATLAAALASETWKKDFRGRDILKELLQEIGVGIKYEMFRNLLVSKMRDKGIQPEGMRMVINAILPA